MSKDKEERVLMKKAKLALGLSAVAVMALGLSACNEVTAKEGVVLTYTDASGNRIEYTANDLLGTYAYGNTAASTSFDKVYELLIRNYYKSASNDVKSSINTDAQKKVDAILENAAKNASSNGTTYEEELEKLLDSNNVENVDELFEAKVYEVEKSRYEDDYYSDANLEAMRDGEDAKGNPFFPDVDDPTQADDEGYLAERAPYHVSHILVKLDADSDLTQGKISAADAKQIGYVIRALAGVNDNGTAQSEESERDSFGAIANRLSDDGSADSYGELGIVDTNTVFEQYVQEFGLGMYAYDAIYNKQTSEYRDQHKAKLLPDSDVTFGDHDEAVLDYFKNLGIGTIPFGAAEALLTTAEITDNNGRSVNGGSEVFYPRNIIFNKYFNKHNIAVITPNEIPYNLYKDDAENVMKEVEFVYNYGGISLYGVSKGNFGYDDEGTPSATYAAYPGFQKDTTGIFDNASTAQGRLAAGQNVLTDKSGRVVLVTRAGGDSYQGLHFIIIDRSALDLHGSSAESGKAMMERSTSSKGSSGYTANYAELEDYYTIYKPQEAKYPSYSADGATDALLTYNNFLSVDPTNQEKRRQTVRENITTYNKNIDTYIFQSLVSEQKLEYKQDWVKDLINSYISAKRDGTKRDTQESFEKKWTTYAENLSLEQTLRYGLDTTGAVDYENDNGYGYLISEFAAIGYETSFSTKTASGELYGRGGPFGTK
jgi:hypothetical protein